MRVQANLANTILKDKMREHIPSKASKTVVGVVKQCRPSGQSLNNMYRETLVGLHQSV